MRTLWFPLILLCFLSVACEEQIAKPEPVEAKSLDYPVDGFDDYDGLMCSTREITFTASSPAYSRDSSVAIHAFFTDKASNSAVDIPVVSYGAAPLVKNPSGAYELKLPPNGLSFLALSFGSGLWAISGNPLFKYDPISSDNGELGGYPSIPALDTLADTLKLGNPFNASLLDTLGNMQIVDNDITPYVVFTLRQGDKKVVRRLNGPATAYFFPAFSFQDFEPGEAEVEITAYRSVVDDNFFRRVVILAGSRAGMKVKVVK